MERCCSGHYKVHHQRQHQQQYDQHGDVQQAIVDSTDASRRAIIDASIMSASTSRGLAVTRANYNNDDASRCCTVSLSVCGPRTTHARVILHPTCTDQLGVVLTLSVTPSASSYLICLIVCLAAVIHCTR